MLEMHLAGQQLGDRQDAAYFHPNPPRGARRCHNCRIIIGSLLVVLSTFFVLFLQWNSGVVNVLHMNLPQPVNGDTNAETDVSNPASVHSMRDLKILLHPEDHVSRETQVTYLSWNITSGDIAPDGVVKRVLLINGELRRRYSRGALLCSGVADGC